MKTVLVLSVLATVNILTGANLEQRYFPLDRISTHENSGALKISQGHNATRNQFPYQVSLRMRTIINYYHICGGSILNKNWVLSAAHCTDDYPIDIFQIRAGILDLRDSNIPNQQTIAISSIIPHPDYNPDIRLSPNDISLLRLSTPLTFGFNVQPATLPLPGATPHGYAIVSGWGRLGLPYNSVPDILQYVEVPILTQRECVDLITSITGPNNGFYPGLNMCVVSRSAETGEATCSGDSGGPLAQNGKIVGVVSWGYNPCGNPGFPSVFVKVSTYVNWIKGIIGPNDNTEEILPLSC